jgi:hypothetical protein
MTAMITNAAGPAAGRWQQRRCFDQAALYFMKDCISLILLLSTIFTAAERRILTNMSSASYCAAAEFLLAQMNFMDYCSINLLYDTYNNHVTASASFSITNRYIRNL